ncbi:MAG: hypothetical protein IMZ53_12730 [Thermoplasmata archaeon]|nr:hypothetical protein [Thermoplasmata archaeon]
MSHIIGWYYLHKNGELIYKNYPDAITDIRESDLCLSAWYWDGERLTSWDILVESLSLGVNKNRIDELAKKWKCDNVDAIRYADFSNVTLGIDGNQCTATRTDFVNLAESPCGFGNTNLEALADLCKQLGYKGGKMWNAKFRDLTKPLEKYR